MKCPNGEALIQEYGGRSCQVLHKLNERGTLPFTGLNVAAFVIAALILIVAGVMLRRATN